jgi:hypothetical protein
MPKHQQAAGQSRLWQLGYWECPLALRQRAVLPSIVAGSYIDCDAQHRYCRMSG